MTTNFIVKLEKASKKYAKYDCLKEVSLEIKNSEFIVIKGKNGSGKSTLLKLVSGLIPVTSGQRLMCDEQTNIGYTPDQITPLKMTSTEYLTHMGKISSIPYPQLKDKITALHQLFHLEQRHDLHMTQFSKGMLQKLNVMQAMLNEPQLLVLDEPFSGLDERTIQQLCSSLIDVNKLGTTVILTTHEALPVNNLEYSTYWIEEGRLLSEVRKDVKEQSNRSYRLICHIEEDVHKLLLSLYPMVSSTIEKNGLVSFTLTDSNYRQLLLTLLEKNGDIIKLERME